MSEWDIKWKLSWVNFMLYMGAIHSCNDEVDEPVEEMHAADIF